MTRHWLIVGAPAVYAVAAPCPAQAAQEIDFSVPPGTLNDALVSFATQARLSIDTSDPALRSVRVGGLRGRFTLRGGLRRLLRGSGYDFRISRGTVVRIIRRPVRANRQAGAARRTLSARPSPPPRLLSAIPQPIVVTASKQSIALGDYPGAIRVASFDEAQGLRFGAGGGEILLRQFPNLASTHLGSGRNKIFVRGIADSSFTGQSQATISQYLGESRLTYSAPDPDLALYDIEKVEILEGPQGTLFGAGSLGGVIHLVPRSPRTDGLEIAATAAITSGANELGAESAVVANVPLAPIAAARIVAYRNRRPGYIDDIRRNLADINRTDVSGLRATVRVEPADGLAIDIGVVAQDTASRDGQYTDARASSALTRRSAIAQPFVNAYRLAFATIRAEVGAAKLLSNTSYTRHVIDTVFDATSATSKAPTAFKEDTRVSLISHETRLTGSARGVSSWVAGLSVARNVNDIKRSIGPVGAPRTLSDIQSETIDAAAFGEATLPIWRDLSLTGGGRLAFVRQLDQFHAMVDDDSAFEPTRTRTRFLPAAALSLKPARGVIAYVRYQEGFRPGAQQLTQNGDLTSVSRFESDEIRTTELGIRSGSRTGAALSGGLSYAYSRWNNVQADLVTSTGFPYIANLGSGFVRYASADLTWRPAADLSLEAAGFLAASRLDRPTAQFAVAGERELPNIADSGWRLTGRYEPWIGSTKIRLDWSIGHVGSSQLGVGDPFEIRQGGYLDTTLGARAEFDSWGISLDVENLLDSRANRFSYGNPFSVAAGDQRTPLRPRSIRVGIDKRF